MSTRREAVRLAAEVAEILTASMPHPAPEILATTNPRDIAGALLSGALVAVLNPPTLTYPTWTQVDAAWTLWLITGPSDDADTAWDTLDLARERLVTPLGLDTATPDAFTDGTGTTWAALVCEFRSEHDRPDPDTLEE